ncbi:hypothetical protein Tco_1021538, partial [Tanacetum coccineum]
MNTRVEVATQAKDSGKKNSATSTQATKEKHVRLESVPTMGTSFGQKGDKVGLNAGNKQEVNWTEEESESNVDEGFNGTTKFMSNVTSSSNDGSEVRNKSL